MTEFIDTHTHLYEEAFQGESGQAIERAVDAGVTKMIFPDIDSSTRDAMNSLAAKYPGNIFPCLGLHPTSVDSRWKEALEEISEAADKAGNIRAIGETGMDCYWSKEFVREQEEAFEWQVRLACRLGLPVIIHAREATELIIGVLERCRQLAPRGVFHAFTGSREKFERISRLGDWYVGIGGVVNFKKASIAETIKHIPLERILLETDSPYLTPVPHRGERNESSYLPYIAGKIAEQKGISIEEVALQTTENAVRLFQI